MKQVLSSDWNYILLEDNNKYFLKVICGNVGIFELETALDEAQTLKFKEQGEVYINQLAKEIRSKY